MENKSASLLVSVGKALDEMSLSLCGRQVVELLTKNEINCVALHCIIHQEALCGKVLKMMSVMQSVIKMVDLRRSGHKAHRYRGFLRLLRELDAEFSDLPMYTSIRWLSAGKRY